MTFAAGVFGFLLTLRAAAAPVDFSGVWIPDPGKATYTKELKTVDPTEPDASAAPPGNLPAPPPLRISRAANHVILEFMGADGAAITTLKLASDGREVTNPRGMLTQISTSHWENDTFVTVWRLHRRDVMIMEGVDTWRLSPDGTTLTIESRMEDSKSRSTTSTTYSKRN